MKRVIALCLALIMVLCLLTACGDEGSETTAAVSEEGDQSWKTEHPTWLCGEKQTLKVMTYDSVDGSEGPDNDQEFWKWLEEYTNVEIEWEIIPYAGYEEVVKARMTANKNMPDIINTWNVASTTSFGGSGLLLDLSEYWDEYFVNTKAYFAEEGTDYQNLIADGEGHIYALFGTTEPVEGHQTLMYNTEWLKKLGVTELPKTLDEFTELLRKMKAYNDINGNGSDDEVYLTTPNITSLIAVLDTAFGMEQYCNWEPFVADENGVVSDEYTSQAQRNMLSYFNMLFEEGLLDSEVLSMNVNKATEKCASDRVGVIAYYSGYAVTFGSMTPASIEANDPTGEYFTLGYPLSSDMNGNQNIFMRREVANSTPTAITAVSENKELAMKWLDVLYGDKTVLEVRTCGIEGEHYTKNEDGSKTLIQPEDGSQWSGIEGGMQISLAFIQTKEQLLNTKTASPWYLEQYDALRSECTWLSPSVVHPNGYTEDEQEIIDNYFGDIKKCYQTYRNKFIKGEMDVDNDGDWNTFVKEINKLGLAELTKAWQSIYDRTVTK